MHFFKKTHRTKKRAVGPKNKIGPTAKEGLLPLQTTIDVVSKGKSRTRRQGGLEGYAPLIIDCAREIGAMRRSPFRGRGLGLGIWRAEPHIAHE